MNDKNLNELEQIIATLRESLRDDAERVGRFFFSFVQTPDLAMQFIDYLDALTEESVDLDDSEYSACIYAFELGLAELQIAHENGSRQAGKTLNHVMTRLATTMNQNKHTAGYWMPVLNIFYDLRVELLPMLQDAYLDLAEMEAEEVLMDEPALQNNMQSIIRELSDLSDCEIAENFFAQSHAMPPEFIGQLVMDLYQLEEGREVALLALLHPKADFRDVAVEALDMIMQTHTLSSKSLTRLLSIKLWYPDDYQDTFRRWIKMQRKQGVTFSHEKSAAQIISIKASEVDGTGAQGFYLHYKIKKQSYLCGTLTKEGVGIKDVWVSPPVTLKETQAFYANSYAEDGITMREVSQDHFEMMANHFLAVMLAQGTMPQIQLFEIQEILGIQFKPALIQSEALIKQLCVKIAPFTESTIQQSLKRSKSWAHTKRFTESWFLESAEVDKLVNNHSTIYNGAKVCHLPEAMRDIFEKIFEKQRGYWMFHFLKMSLWAGSKPHKSEKLSLDNLLIAHVIQEGIPLEDIPIMVEICRQTVMNSVETMNERKTYLS